MIYRVVNVTRSTTLGTQILQTESSAERRAGLLKRQSLPDGSGLWIAPCEAIHTCFMQFAIDVVFLDREKRVRKIQSALRPWRLSFCLTAHSVLELPAGAAERASTTLGDQLQFESGSLAR